MACKSLIPEVYILWHPRCPAGSALAERILKWLRPGDGLGPEVFFRCLPAPGLESGLPIPLPGEYRPGTAGIASCPDASRKANLQIIIPLLEANLVADPAWREWMRRLPDASGSHYRRMMLPVALDPTAYNIPGKLRDLNFLRPAGLPPDGSTPDAAALETIARSLLKQLTEALCRLMLSGIRNTDPTLPGAPGAGATADKLKIFLSHAKADGTGPARRLRDYIYSQTQLAAFYDENDIAFGSIFSRVLDTSIQDDETAALIAVRSARYAFRPWCRRELSLFRRPRPEPPADGDIAEPPGFRWRLYPTLVVDALEPGAETPGIPEFGNSPCLRWDDDLANQEERIVTTVLRDVMLSAFHSALGNAIPHEPNRIVINWIPDPTTLLRLPPVCQPSGELDIIHPGRGLSSLELDTLYDFFPHLTFHSFEETLS